MALDPRTMEGKIKKVVNEEMASDPRTMEEEIKEVVNEEIALDLRIMEGMAVDPRTVERDVKEVVNEEMAMDPTIMDGDVKESRSEEMVLDSKTMEGVVTENSTEEMALNSKTMDEDVKEIGNEEMALDSKTMEGDVKEIGNEEMIPDPIKVKVGNEEVAQDSKGPLTVKRDKEIGNEEMAADSKTMEEDVKEIGNEGMALEIPDPIKLEVKAGNEEVAQDSIAMEGDKEIANEEMAMESITMEGDVKEVEHEEMAVDAIQVDNKIKEFGNEEVAQDSMEADIPTEEAGSRKRKMPSSLETLEAETLSYLDTCQFEIEGLMDKEAQETLKLGRKYSKMRIPYYERREKLLQKLPNFWSKVILNHPYMRTMITVHEKQYLQYLSSFEIEDVFPTDDSAVTGYQMKFSFKENPHFENRTLIKSCLSIDDETWRLEKCEINWKEQSRVISTKTAAEKLTFFAWLSTDGTYSEEDPTSHTFKTDIWFNPFVYHDDNYNSS